MNDEPRHRTEDTSIEWEAAVGRAAIYGFTARSLLYPTDETQRAIRVELVPLLDGLSSTSAELEELLAGALDAHDVDIEELRRAHGRIFTHIENEDCPAHESAYSPGDVFRRADVMADVAAFYKAHGVQAGGKRRERIDHVTTELEFLSFLARKEAYAIEHLGPDEVEECRRSQEHFLRDHVGCWVPGFSARLQVVADHPFFVAIGSLLGMWIETDLDWLGIEPPVRLTEPQPLPPPDDDGCGADISGFTDTPVEMRS
jgi:DMSO reductase family type II enzyme chaperone